MGCPTDIEALTMFERSGRYDCCTLLPYLNMDMSVLDFAGGIGRVALPVSKYVNNVTVVDYSEDMIRIGTEYCKNRPNIWFVRSRMTLPFPDNMFDLVYFFLCVCHLQHESNDFNYWIEENKRVLKPNGVMVFDTHAPIDTNFSVDLNLVESFKKYQLATDFNTMIYVLKKVDIK